MADAQPLNKQIPIIDPVSGCPTDYFIKWAQQFNSSALGEIFAGAGINISAGPTITADQQAILDAIDNTQGSILYRDADEWKALAPGTAGHFLKTNGAAANPEWAAGGGGGGSSYIVYPLIKPDTTFTRNVNSTSYITVGGPFSFSIDLAEFPFTHYRIIFQGNSNASGQSITIQVVEGFSAPTSPIHAGGNDMVIDNTSSLRSTTWLERDNDFGSQGILRTFEIALRGSNSTVDLTVARLEVQLKIDS